MTMHTVEMERTAVTDRRRATFEKLRILRHVQTDLACDQCGHNLRTQPIRRDPRTRLDLCRCPQCGSFHPTRQAQPPATMPGWAQYLARSLMYLWLIIIGSGGVGIAFAQGTTMLVTLELLTTHHRVPRDVLRQPGYHGPARTYHVKSNLREYQVLTAATLVFSLGLVFTAGLVGAVVFYHFSTLALLGFAAFEPIVIGFGAIVAWKALAPELLTWGVKLIALHATVQIVAGMAGVFFGRPLVRLLATFAVPPGMRPVLAHLWETDQLVTPDGRARSLITG